MASPSKVNCTGASGEKYVCYCYKIGEELDEIPGVYIFSKRSNNKKWSPIYVGETGDLSDRFDDHHKKDCIEEEGATHICVFTQDMGKKKDRKAVEEDLIDKYDPPCNG